MLLCWFCHVASQTFFAKDASIEDTMLVAFDIKFIKRDQKLRRNGEACRASPICFWSNLISKDTNVVL